MVDIDEVIRKTKRRKVDPDEFCDMKFVDYGSSVPRLLNCGNGGVKFIPEFGWFGLHLCSEHFDLECERRRD